MNMKFCQLRRSSPVTMNTSCTSVWPFIIASTILLVATSLPLPSSITEHKKAYLSYSLFCYMCKSCNHKMSPYLKVQCLPILCSVLATTRFKLLCCNCCFVGLIISSPLMSPIRTAPKNTKVPNVASLMNAGLSERQL